MEVRNIFLMIHGMVTNPLPEEPYGQYITFWNELVKAKPELGPLFSGQPIQVEWGHQLLPNVEPDINLRPDQALTGAERHVHDKVAFENLKKTKDPNYKFSLDFGIPILRQTLMNVRESVVTYGLGDVVYYCSEEGEAQVREVIYSQVLNRLEAEANNAPLDTVFVLHAFGHSLGVTVIHDLLYGLFNHRVGYEPGFPKQGSPETVKLFKRWRERAHSKLRLGALISAASQLPILFLRKNDLVRLFYEARRFPEKHIGVDPAAIGILPKTQNETQWKIFYDIDDVLGFSTRGLYSPNDMIEDIQVDSGALPESAHTEYWYQRHVIDETAELMLKWAKNPVLVDQVYA